MWIAIVAMGGVTLAGAPVSADGPPGREWRPFWVAVERGDLRVVNALLAACADERMPGPGDARKLSDWLEACQDVGVGVRNFGRAALYVAAKEGHADIARLLIEAGADVEASARGAWPLSLATGGGTRRSPACSSMPAPTSHARQ